jgi:integrase
MAVIEEQNPLTNFMYALKAPETKRQWPGRLKIVLDFLHLEGTLEQQAKIFVIRAREKPDWVQQKLMQFFSYQIERVQLKEISETTIPNYYKAAKLFCEMNDLLLNWKKISRMLPKRRNAANDRAPTIEELQKLIEYPDRRIKPIIYTMVSPGFRIGAWDYLQWKHVIPIPNNDGEIAAAKLRIYAGDREEYYAFVTPEEYGSLRQWMEFRAGYGEIISSESWVMRDLWQTTNVDHGFKNGLATSPKKLKSSGIKKIIERALWEQGIRHTLPVGIRRHEWKAAHGLRKFFKTRAEQAMRPANVELLMGHDIGISTSYYKPTEREILDDYLKAVDLLTINGGNAVLQKQVQELKDKSKDSEYIIKGKLEDKEKEIHSLKDDMNSMRDDMNNIFEILKIAKRNNGSLAKDRTMLDEKGCISFCQDYEDGRTISVKIPIGMVEIGEDETEQNHK